jgi:hypothetical protein
MFEACMLLAFLCAGLCHLLPPQPPSPQRPSPPCQPHASSATVAGARQSPAGPSLRPLLCSQVSAKRGFQ